MKKHDLAFTEDVGKRFEAYNWQVPKVEDGNDIDAIRLLLRSQRSRQAYAIEIRTGSDTVLAKQGKASVHGEPLGAENLLEAKKFLGYNTEEEFYVPRSS